MYDGLISWSWTVVCMSYEMIKITGCSRKECECMFISMPITTMETTTVYTLNSWTQNTNGWHKGNVSKYKYTLDYVIGSIVIGWLLRNLGASTLDITPSRADIVGKDLEEDPRKDSEEDHEEKKYYVKTLKMLSCFCTFSLRISCKMSCFASGSHCGMWIPLGTK